VLLRWSE